MAAITFTASQVQAVTGATKSTVTAGVAVTAGQAVYRDTTDNNRYKLAQSDDAERAGLNGIGIAVNDAAKLVKQSAAVAPAGEVDFGAAQTGVDSGVTLCVGPTAGQINPDADIVATNKKTVLGIVKDGGQILVVQTNVSNATV